MPTILRGEAEPIKVGGGTRAMMGPDCHEQKEIAASAPRIAARMDREGCWAACSFWRLARGLWRRQFRWIMRHTLGVYAQKSPDNQAWLNGMSLARYVKPSLPWSQQGRSRAVAADL